MNPLALLTLSPDALCLLLCIMSENENNETN